jgi:hypothetical protein
VEFKQICHTALLKLVVAWSGDLLVVTCWHCYFGRTRSDQI